MEAAQPPTLARPIDTLNKGFRTSECYPWTDKPVTGTLLTSVKDHMLICDHKIVHEDFKFLGNESNRYLLE